jgi:hypothetical protein
VISENHGFSAVEMIYTAQKKTKKSNNQKPKTTMKKKVIIACASLVAIIAVALPSFSMDGSENSLIQQNFSVIKIGENPGLRTCETQGVFKTGVTTFMCEICDWNPNTGAATFSSTSTC